MIFKFVGIKSYLELELHLQFPVYDTLQYLSRPSYTPSLKGEEEDQPRARIPTLQGLFGSQDLNNTGIGISWEWSVMAFGILHESKAGINRRCCLVVLQEKRRKFVYGLSMCQSCHRQIGFFQEVLTFCQKSYRIIVQESNPL